MISPSAGQPEMDDKHGGTTDHRPQPSRPGRIREWVAIILGIACLGFAIYVLWAQNTGTTADVKVLECHRVAGVRSSSNRCSGQWQDGTTTSEVHIIAMFMPHPGDTAQMAIHGSKAYPQSAGIPLMSFGFGAAALFVGGYARRRRQGL
jgi:hypothetical protein